MAKEQPIPAKSRVAFLVLLAVGISLLLLWVIMDFVVALVLAAALAGIAHPIHRRLARWLRGREGIAAALTVLLALVLVIVPTVLLLGVLLRDAARIGETAKPWIEEQLRKPGGLRTAIEENSTLRKLLPYEDEIAQKAGELAGKTASYVARAVADGATGAARFFLMLFITLYAMFTFLKRGRAILAWIFAYMPLSVGDRRVLVRTFASVARATLMGKLVIGIAQGALVGVALAVVGINGAVFWGAVAAVSSVVPVVGTALVWAPAVLYLAVTGRVEAAVGLAAWCAVVVGTVDNILQPMLVGRATKMSDLMVLVTTLGGLTLFGPAGIVIGPIVGALFTTVWALWGAAVEEVGLAAEVAGVAGGDDSK